MSTYIQTDVSYVHGNSINQVKTVNFNTETRLKLKTKNNMNYILPSILLWVWLKYLKLWIINKRLCAAPARRRLWSRRTSSERSEQTKTWLTPPSGTKCDFWCNNNIYLTSLWFSGKLTFDLCVQQLMMSFLTHLYFKLGSAAHKLFIVVLYLLKLWMMSCFVFIGLVLAGLPQKKKSTTRQKNASSRSADSERWGQFTFSLVSSLTYNSKIP